MIGKTYNEKLTSSSFFNIVYLCTIFNSFDIITFNNEAKIWYPSRTKKCSGKQQRLTTECVKSEAQKKIFDLRADRGHKECMETP